MRVAVLALTILMLPALAVAQPRVREVAKHDLHDVAVASYDEHGPVIYYNPARLKQRGPNLAAFIRAHEYAHLKLRHHHRHSRLQFDRDGQRRHFELEADCQAASWLRDSNPEAIEAALRYFAEQPGKDDAHAHHPSGLERAETVRECGES